MLNTTDKYSSYMRFGIAGDYDYTTTLGREIWDNEAFAYGSVTSAAEMPTTGTATYKGFAFVGHPVLAFAAGNNMGASFNVNFGSKKITGDIDMGQNQHIKLSGDISGASFSGTNNGTEMRGNFFGPQAAELGGVFSGLLSGSFGAKKQ